VKNIDPIPGAIVAAICKVQASIEAVGKSQFNKHGQYKFASTDDIYAAVARKFGEVGLLIYPLELSQPEIKRIEKTDKDGNLAVSQWGQFHYGYQSWFHESSARTILIQITGPQTFNAAESYCQKQFLRALLKLPTGDMDLDSMPQAETEEAQAAASAPVKRKSSNAAKKDGTDKVFKEIMDKLKLAPNDDICRQIRDLYAQEWAEMPFAWRELLDHTFEDRMEALGGDLEPAQ
jgi:ERF superfamily